MNHAWHKSIKSNVCADFIYTDNKGVIISTNNVASNSDLQEIEKYIKNSLQTNDDNIVSPRLPQSKSYLKIISISYFIDKSNTCISSEDIEHILKNNHMFNDIVLASKPRIIKVSPKSDMAIVWIDIWDTQNGNNAKKIINRRFNIGNVITTVRGANMNPDVPQCKNCWKWGHLVGSVEFKTQNVPNVMGLILLTIIVTLHSVVKLTINSTLLDWKPRRVNHAHIRSSISTVRVLMVLILWNVHSRNTVSTRSGTPR